MAAAIGPYAGRRTPQGVSIGKATDPTNGRVDGEAYAAAMARLPAYSPEWWVVKLEADLDLRRPVVDLYEDYYEGRHRLAFASSKYREAFAEMLAAVSDNWLPLVIGATTERLRLRGFTFGGATATDEDAWSLWRQNELDTDASLVWTESSKHGEAYFLVWPEPVSEPGFFGRLVGRRSEERARITVEHPAQVIVARESGDRRRRAAALKKWRDDSGLLMATLYLPDAIYRFEREDRANTRWRARRGVDYLTTHAFGVVPVIPVVTNPAMTPARPPTSMLSKPHGVPDVAIGLGRSDLADVISTQDQINKLVSDMLVASEFAGFRQRWATGLEVPDDETEGEVEPPFKAAIDRLWIGTSKETNFGEFSETNLSNFIEAFGSRIESMAARTRTPPHYLLARIVNVSGDALAAAETGLGRKAEDRTGHHGAPALETVRLGFMVSGDERANQPGTANWHQTQSRSESEYTDALVKRLAIGVPKEQLWRDAGYSDDQIKSWRRMLRDQAALEGVDVSLLPAIEDDADPSPPAAA